MWKISTVYTYLRIILTAFC